MYAEVESDPDGSEAMAIAALGTIEVEECTDTAYCFHFELPPGAEVRIEALRDAVSDGNPGIVLDLSWTGRVGEFGPVMDTNFTIEGAYENGPETWTLFQILFQELKGEWIYSQDNIDTELQYLRDSTIMKIVEQAWERGKPKVAEWLG
jgi:hypothetical protein